jgi:hypothetical protein
MMSDMMSSESKTKTDKESRIPLCFLSREAHDTTFRFAEQMARDNKNYSVCICIDADAPFNIPFEYDATLVEVLAVTRAEAEKHGFLGSVDHCNGRACSRDMALYHFCCKYGMDTTTTTTTTPIWFIEDDVFIPTTATIRHLDEKYGLDADLICASNTIKKHGDDGVYWSQWPKIEGRIDLPWAYSMICAVRVSPALLALVRDYAAAKGRLLFDEALFNTLALHNDLRVETPPELANITFTFCEFPYEKIDDVLCLYHPVRHRWDHEGLRMRQTQP